MTPRDFVALADLCHEFRECDRCDLRMHRKQMVFGEGNMDSPPVMFIGEAPGENEDKCGRPFVGTSGETLDKMIRYLGLDRTDVYIANAVMCRPPNNRDPNMSEIEACRTRLGRQIRIVNPKIIVLLGRVATTAILGYEFKGPLKQFMENESFLAVDLNGQEYLAAVVWHPSAHLRGRTNAAKATGPMWRKIKEFVTNG